MSYDGLKSRFEAFKLVVSDTISTVTFHHLASEEFTVPAVKARLVEYIITAVELQCALRARREGEVGPEERRLEETAASALENFVRAVKAQLEAVEAVARMKRNEEVVRGAVEELLERAVDGSAE